MSGYYGIYRNGERVGTVAIFPLQPRPKRWAAYAPLDRRQTFPTKRQAVDWLRQLAEEDEEDEEVVP